LAKAPGERGGVWRTIIVFASDAFSPETIREQATQQTLSFYLGMKSKNAIDALLLYHHFKDSFNLGMKSKNAIDALYHHLKDCHSTLE
jgi:hypothetical protein